MGFIVGGVIVGGLALAGTIYASNQQADAARYANNQAAGAAIYAANRQAAAAVSAAQINASAQRRAAAMEMYAMNQSMEMQQRIADDQIQQTEKLAMREELRFLVGNAAKDSFEKVSSAFVNWAQVNDFAEETRMRAQFGLENDSRFDSPTPEPDMWRMQNFDSLTGERITDENPYRLESEDALEEDAVGDLFPMEDVSLPDTSWMEEGLDGEAPNVGETLATNSFPQTNTDETE